MSVKIWNMLLVLALVVVLFGGGYVLYQNYQQKQVRIAAEKLEAEALALKAAEAKKQETEVLNKAFEVFLNDFLARVHGEVVEYRQGRVVLNDLGKPENLREAEYIEENARMAEATVMALQLKMNDIMALFDEADSAIQPLLEQFDEEDRVLVSKTWSDVRVKNAEHFMAYFTSEQQILNAQLKLIEFYNENSGILRVDDAQKHILFDSVEKQEEEALLRGQIIKFRALQKDFLTDGRVAVP